jgi:hypothetical protein
MIRGWATIKEQDKRSNEREIIFFMRSFFWQHKVSRKACTPAGRKVQEKKKPLQLERLKLYSKIN